MSLAKGVRANLSRSSWIRKMFELGISLKSRHGADSVADLSLGNPILEPPIALRERLTQLSSEPGIHRYMPNTGFVETRRKIATVLSKREGITLTEHNIAMVGGAGAGINIVLNCLLDPGDEVVIFAPYFVEYLFYVENYQARVVVSETGPDFLPNVEDLAKRLTSNTKAVLINAPNNPTGRVYSAALLDSIAKALETAAQRFGNPIFLISDEPYRKLTYEGEAPSILSRYRNSIIVTSHSKDLGLAGERIGYAYFRPDINAPQLLDAISFTMRAYGYVNAPALFQRVVEDFQETSIDISEYRRKRDHLCAALHKLGYEFSVPEGAFYLFPRSPLPDDVEFCMLCAEELLLVVPGISFGRAGHFRISYCVDDATIERAIAAFTRIAERLAPSKASL